MYKYSHIVVYMYIYNFTKIFSLPFVYTYIWDFFPLYNTHTHALFFKFQRAKMLLFQFLFALRFLANFHFSRQHHFFFLLIYFSPHKKLESIIFYIYIHIYFLQYFLLAFPWLWEHPNTFVRSWALPTSVCSCGRYSTKHLAAHGRHKFSKQTLAAQRRIQ